MKITTQMLKEMIEEEYQMVLKENAEERLAQLERTVAANSAWIEGIAPVLQEAGYAAQFDPGRGNEPVAPIPFKTSK